MRSSELGELAAFAAIAREGNFRRAAAQLELKPSTLSSAIRALESRLGVRLLNRTTRSVSLTEAGQQLFTTLAPALEEIDAALETVNGFRAHPMGRLRPSVPRRVCAALPGTRPLHGGDDTPPAISDNRGDGVGTDIDPYGDGALPTAEGRGKVSGTTHIFSVLGGGMASPRGHHSTQ